MAGTPSKRRILEPVGYCIYCGTRDAKLTKEHVIPESLYGLDFLPEASCLACAERLKSLDGYLARHIYYKIRLRDGIKTKNAKSKNHPTVFNATVHKNGRPFELETDIAGHPYVLTVPHYPEPGILQGIPAREFYGEMSVTSIMFLPDSAKRAVDLVDGDFVSVGPSNTVNALKFARAIAKIAYANFVAMVGLSLIEEPLILPVIMGESSIIPHFVGCVGGAIPPRQFGLDGLHTFRFSAFRVGGRLVFGCDVRLFAEWGAEDGSGLPVYRVIIGYLTDAAQRDLEARGPAVSDPPRPDI